MKTPFFLRFLLLIPLFCLAFSTNENINALRVLNSDSADPGEVIEMSVELGVGDIEDQSLRGVYVTDHIPEELVIEELSSYHNYQAFEMEYEVETSGIVYPFCLSHRLIAEVPIDFSENRPLQSGDTLCITFLLRIPETADQGTIYTFPGFSFIGRIIPSEEDVFGCEDPPEKTITVKPEQGIKGKVEDVHPSIQIWPNPFTSVLYVACYSSPFTATLYDASGKRVLRSTHSHTDYAIIDIKEDMLPEGVYFCMVKTDKGSSITKVVKLLE